MCRAVVIPSVLVGLIFCGPKTQAADPGQLPVPPGWRQKEIHDPSHRRYVDFQPNGLLRRGHNVTVSGSFSVFDPFWQFQPSWGWRRGWDWGWYDRPNYYDYWDYRPVYGAGPVFVPAEQLFGLGPVVRMMGVQPRQRVVLEPQIVEVEAPAQANPKQANNNNVNNNANRQPRQEKPRPVVANAQGRERAARFIQFGNQHFAKQAFLAAHDSFKSAAEAAPDLLDAHLRRAQALVALRQYANAAKVYKRAMTLDPTWARTAFRIGDLYGDDAEGKEAHVDALAQAVADQPNDAELNLVLAMQLFLDEQEERSRPFFEHFVALSGEKDMLPQNDIRDDAVAKNGAGAPPQPMPPPAAKDPQPNAGKPKPKNGVADF